MYCPRCGLGQPAAHRFCVACGTTLPHDLLTRRGPKVSRWFATIPVSEHDRADAAVRVTRYVEEFDMETDDGVVRVPSHHVRISIWHGDHAVAAVSLPDDEAEALATFVLSSVSQPDGEPAPR